MAKNKNTHAFSNELSRVVLVKKKIKKIIIMSHAGLKEISSKLTLRKNLSLILELNYVIA